MDGNTKCVVDASFVLAFLLPDEEIPDVESLFDEHKLDQVSLVAPYLLPFEVFNSLKMAIKRHRLSEATVSEVAIEFIGLNIGLVSTHYEKALGLAIKHDLSFYDASYLSLSRGKNLPLLTLDKKLKRLAR